MLLDLTPQRFELRYVLVPYCLNGTVYPIGIYWYLLMPPIHRKEAPNVYLGGECGLKADNAEIHVTSNERR